MKNLFVALVIGASLSAPQKMVQEFKLGACVMITANTKSISERDHREKPWQGRVVELPNPALSGNFYRIEPHDKLRGPSQSVELYRLKQC